MSQTSTEQIKQFLERAPLGYSLLLALQHVWRESQLAADLGTRWRESYHPLVHATVLANLALDGHHELLGYHPVENDGYYWSLVEEEHLNRLVEPMEAAYDLLRRTPLPIVASLVQDSADVLRRFLPPQAPEGTIPQSLQDYTVIVLHTRKIKSTSWRRKAPVAKGAVALDGVSGLVLAMGANQPGPGDTTDRLPDVVEQLRERTTSRPVLYITEGKRCTVRQLLEFTEHEEDFLARYRSLVRFEADEQQPARQGETEDGHQYTEEWGWLRGTVGQVYVRRIVETPADATNELALVSSLVDPDQYPAVDLLTAYHQRWKIDPIMREIAAHYRLGDLIGGGQRAAIVQEAFWLVFYNALLLLAHAIAAVKGWHVRMVSLHSIYHETCCDLRIQKRNVHRSRILWLLGDAAERGESPVAGATRAAELWRKAWLKGQYFEALRRGRPNV